MDPAENPDCIYEFEGIRTNIVIQVNSIRFEAPTEMN